MKCTDAKKSLKLGIVLGSSLLLALCTASCNLFGAMDEAESPEDQYALAVARANAGECAQARDILGRLENRTDDMNAALGWAELCITGATARNIALSLYSYTGNSTNYSVVGVLSRTMLPVNAEKLERVTAAVSAFSRILEPSRKSLLVAIAQFVKAAAVLGAQAINSSDTGSLDKVDIGGSSCTTTTCGAAFALANCTSPMSNADVVTFTNAIADAATALELAGATDLKTLAQAIRTGLGGTNEFARCFIHNQTIPQ